MRSRARSRRHASVARERADLAQQRGGLVGGEVERGAAGMQVAQQDVQAVEDPDAFAGQVVAALGEQTQLGGVVLGHDGAQPFVAHGDVGDAGRVGGVGLAGAAGVQQSGAGGEGGRHVDDVFAGGGEQLGDAAPEAGGAFDGESALRPPGRPGASTSCSAPALTVTRLVARCWPVGSSATAVREALCGSMPMVITTGGDPFARTGGNAPRWAT